MQKDTIRLILFLDCNLSCAYCCNEQEQFSSQFIKKDFNDIDFSKYENVCITGGEPFLYPESIWYVINKIPKEKTIYIYTNGTVIAKIDIQTLKLLIANGYNITVNIGLHSLEQFEWIIPIEKYWIKTRYSCNIEQANNFLALDENRLKDRLKTYKLNECNMPNEDWILLNESFLIDVFKWKVDVIKQQNNL